MPTAPTARIGTTTTLLLARHGETDWNREGRYQGRKDIPLNNTGRDQAGKLAASLLTAPIAAVYSSPLSRAEDTAAAAADLHAMEVTTLDGLAEINHGDWEGLLVTEAAARWPDGMRAWKEAPQTVRMPHGEMLEDVQKRGNSAVGQILHQVHGGVVFAVAHDAVNRALLCSWLGMPLAAFWRIRQDAACLNVIQFTREATTGWTPRVCLVNSLAHFGKLWADSDHAAR
ncbi:MAG: histidine phosphatase family protein [Planctomycetes bacterium]|nr:histidine phosphatase family protein [Planctomycetota bacterium]